MYLIACLKKILIKHKAKSNNITDALNKKNKNNTST